MDPSARPLTASSRLAVTTRVVALWLAAALVAPPAVAQEAEEVEGRRAG